MFNMVILLLMLGPILLASLFAKQRGFSFGSQLGAVTVTFTSPVTGVTPPTAAQAATQNTSKATVAASADGDTTATVTHNLAFTTAELAQGYPEVVLEPLTAAGALSTWAITAKAANTITLTKSTATGSGAAPAQLAVTVKRVHSMIQ